MKHENESTPSDSRTGRKPLVLRARTRAESTQESSPNTPPIGSMISLYSLDDVRAALGLRQEIRSGFDGWLDEPSCLPKDTEHQARLSAILERGEAGRWREVAPPRHEALAVLNGLEGQAPHLVELIRLVRRNIRAAFAMAAPMFMAPTLLVGEPGMGKSWLMTKIAAALALPIRTYPMSLSSLSEGLGGSHPSWRNASPGIVAQALLREQVANPVIVVDELDKAQAGAAHNADPYRPFYTLLDPAGARHHVDEYLGFGLNAGRILWVAAANDTATIPGPILDRLTIIEVPPMTREHRRAVARSVFEEQNGERGGFFGPLSDAACDRLADLHPRAVRIAIEDAMAEAASAGRRELVADDVRPRAVGRRPRRVGFNHFEG